MHAIHLCILLNAFSAASARLSARQISDPAGMYLDAMCYPLLSNSTRSWALNISISQLVPSLANSPFPCEQYEYIWAVCTANGTTEIDFLAEQECLCGGSFFETQAACSACFFAHGYQGSTPEEAASARSSLSNAECMPTPPFQPYSNLLPPINFTSIDLPLTLGTDKFPNNTAVSNYFTTTGTASLTLGTITGSATGRLTSWTNFDGIRYTPTSIPPNNGTATATGGSATTSPPTGSAGAGGNGASSSSSTSSANVAAPEVKINGGLLAGVLGVIVLL